jgi:hypothetical protein
MEDIKTTSLAEAIEKALGTDAAISPYRLAKIATGLVGREVLAQLTYSYCHQGLIKASHNSTGRWAVSHADAAAWLTKYVPKHQIG